MYDCHYCGAPADTKDHIIPISWQRNVNRKHTMVGTGETVDCCRECNNLLGAKPLFTIEERAEEIARILSRRYKKELNAAYWSPEELAELGPSLQNQIKAKQFLRDEVLERIRNALSVACGALQRAEPLYSAQTMFGDVKTPSETI